MKKLPLTNLVRWLPLNSSWWDSGERTVATLVTAAAIWWSRLGFLPANASPLGGFGFFGGSSWLGMVLFSVVIVLFDLVVGGLYKGFLFTYAGFAMYPLLGMVARLIAARFGARRGLVSTMIALPLASFAFFLLSNAGVWWYWYPHTWEGLMTCYLLAVPFYKNTLLGDVVFGYGYLALRTVVPKLIPGYNTSLSGGVA